MMNQIKKIFLILLIGLSAVGLNPFACAEVQSKEEEALFVAKKAFEDGYYEVSLSLLERFLGNFPDSSKAGEAELLTGQCYFYQNKLVDALAKFESLLNKPSSRNLKDAVLYWIAEVYFKINNLSKSEAFYRKVISEYPNSSYVPLAFYALGWSAFQEHKFQEAYGYFKTIEDKYPKEPQAKEAAFKIIESLYNLKDYAVLRDKGLSYLKFFPGDPVRTFYLYFYLAEAEYYSGNFSQALEYYAKVLKGSDDDKIQALSRLGAGWSYLKLKRYKEAESEFSALKEEGLDKKGVETFLLGRAVLLSETERINEADKIYSRLIVTASDPSIIFLAYQGKADALYNLAKYRESALFYEEALKRTGPLNTPAEIIDKLRYNLGLAFLKQSRPKDAVKELERVVKESSNKAMRENVLLQLGDLYRDLGDYSLALKSYRLLLKDYPQSLYQDYILYQSGAIALKQADYAGVFKLLSDFKTNFPGSEYINDVYYLLSTAYFKKGDYTASVKVLEQSRKESKESDFSPKSLYLLASNWYNLGDFKRAIELFKETVSRSQDTEITQRAEYGIADSFYQLGNKKEALSRFKALRSKYPGSTLTADVVFWLGGYYYQNGEFDLAKRYFLSLIQDFPGSPLTADAYYSLGLISISGPYKDEAIKDFQKVMDSGNLRLKIMAASKLGEIFYQLEDYEKALVFYRKSLDLSPKKDDPELQFKIAESLEASGEIDKAAEEYLKVSGDDKLKAKAYLKLARIYEDREEFNRALKLYKEVIAIGDESSSVYARERKDWIDINIKN